MDKRPTWFKSQVKWADMFSSLKSVDLGAGYAAALKYAKTGEEPSKLSAGAQIVYTIIKIEVDDANDRYEAQLQRAKRARDSKDKLTSADIRGSNKERKKDRKKEGSERLENLSETDYPSASVGDTFPGISDESEEDESKYVTYRQFLALKGGETGDGGRAEPPDGGV